MTIFDLKMMVKSGLDFFFLNSTSPFRVAAAQCKKNLPRKAELPWQVTLKWLVEFQKDLRF
jgi:hypothetical protein